MLANKYDKLVARIDKKLKNGSTFKFYYKTARTENNVFTGMKYIYFWQEAIAVERNEQFIIDNKGMYHSIISAELKGL
jgi:hypothetical protein